MFQVKLIIFFLIISVAAMVGLAGGMVLILYYEATTQVEQLYFIGWIYMILTLGAWLFSYKNKKSTIEFSD